jgi:ubiquinone/menaquinone biosynthesis C-methylase UbiE
LIGNLVSPSIAAINGDGGQGASDVEKWMMAYDEKLDVEEHRTKVLRLVEWLSAIGYKTTGYKLGIDIGGGLGGHAPWLLDLVDRIYVTDVINYNGVQGGGLVSGFIGKYRRYDKHIDESKIEFHRVDASDLIYRDGLFDFVFSVNAFEHIPDPYRALAEILRVAKQGALVFIQFDPTWLSAYGTHLWHLNMEPWLHLLLSQEEFEKEIIRCGGTQQDLTNVRNDMNRVPFHVFREMFSSLCEGHFSASNFTYWSKTPEEDPYASHPNFKKCLALGYSSDDLLARGVQFLGIKA